MRSGTLWLGLTVLLAQLGTAGGRRAPMAHLANQVCLRLAQELEAQGVSRKLSAGMFGMALRAYVRKVPGRPGQLRDAGAHCPGRRRDHRVPQAAR